MSIPAGQRPGQLAELLQNAFLSLSREAVALKAKADSGTMQASDLIASHLAALKFCNDQIVELSAISGVAAAYEANYSTSFTFEAEKNAILTALATLMSGIYNAAPTSVDGYLEVLTLNPDYSLTQREITAAPFLSQLATGCQAIINLIDLTSS